MHIAQQFRLTDADQIENHRRVGHDDHFAIDSRFAMSSSKAASS